MSRSGYEEGYDDLAMGRWRGVVASAIRGKRGQAFLRDLVAALEEMSNKRLIAHQLRKDGEVCALGALGEKRGLNLEIMDPDDSEQIARAFGIATPLAQEVMYLNDEYCYRSTPENRWGALLSWAKKHLKPNETK